MCGLIRATCELLTCEPIVAKMVFLVGATHIATRVTHILYDTTSVFNHRMLKVFPDNLYVNGYSTQRTMWYYYYYYSTAACFLLYG